MSNFEIISDYSKVNLREIPDNILDMSNLKMLFLEKNLLTKLPEDLFYRLPSLMWLDLRNNQLENLPKSIAHHGHLEHLLLTNNNIKKLPNELGLVPNLKALQVADNPLVYPVRRIIQDGTKAIKKYLREQYEKLWNDNLEKSIVNNDEESIGKGKLQNESAFITEEKVLRVVNESSNWSFNQNNVQKEKPIKESKRQHDERPKSRDSTTSNKRKSLERLGQKLSDPKALYPTLRVKKLDHPNKKRDEPLKIIHSIDKSECKISLKSYFNKSGIKGNLERIPENSLKEGWLNKLRILLNDQERILQQERNLRTLSSWRQKKPGTPKTSSESSSRRSEVPYATYPEYSKIPSREELTAQLQSFLSESDISNKRQAQNPSINLEKLINDLVEQLKEMEGTYSGVKSPRTEIDQAGKQIKMIAQIHKRLLKLKATNDYM